MATTTIYPRGTLVRLTYGRRLVHRVLYDYGNDGEYGALFCKIEPVPNPFGDEPRIVDKGMIEPVTDTDESATDAQG